MAGKCYLVVSADGLEGVYEVEADAYGYKLELRGIGIPGLRVDEAESLTEGLQALRAEEERS
jgi:hypothetical protein